MTRKLFLIGAVLLLILPASLWATDITGKWTAEVTQGQQGEVTLTLDLKLDGEKLTGTLDNPSVGPADLKDGKVKGKDVSFYLDRDIQGTQMKIVWKGTITGEDEMKFQREVEMSGGGGGGQGGGQGGGAAKPSPDIIAKRAK